MISNIFQSTVMRFDNNGLPSPIPLKESYWVIITCNSSPTHVTGTLYMQATPCSDIKNPTKNYTVRCTILHALSLQNIIYNILEICFKLPQASLSLTSSSTNLVQVIE